MFTRILVGLDGSVASERALSAAITLASTQQAELLAVSVAEGLPHYAAMIDEVDDFKERAERFFSQIHRDAQERARHAGLELRAVMLAGHAAQAIMEYARAERADLLVIGHSGHTAWGSLMGTTADRLVRHAPCSVLVVRADEDDPRAA